MKVIAYSIPTVNGIIAEENEKDFDFISTESWNRYIKNLKKAGVFVMGRRTYDSSLRTGAFPYDCLNVVMTSQKIENKWGDKAIFTSLKPKEVLDMLNKKGFKEIMITGGQLSASFLKEGLIDEIWIDLMPKIISKGINLFHGVSFDADLELINVEKHEGNELLLKYKIKK